MKNLFKNKNVLIVGIGKSGQSALELLKKCQAFCYIYDQDQSLLKDYVGKFDCNIVSKIDEYSIKIMDYLIISPGVSIFSEPAKLAKLFGVKVLSELELGSYFAKGKIIGITGTNGKTTTSSLVNAILKQAGKSCVLCGNIGDPLTANLLPYKTNYVVEMSSFQLESVNKLKTDICAITNITPNHIDRHLTFANYRNAKFNIFKNSKHSDKLILNLDDKVLNELSQKKLKLKKIFTSARKIANGYFSVDNKLYFSNGKKTKFLFDITGTKLIGKHNLSNILIATAICKQLRIKNKDIQKAVVDFVPLKHRLQFVKNVNGVEYYNDSKSTSPDSTITALNAFDNRPIILMLGGSDKDTKFDKLAKKISKSDVKLAIICGDTSKKIAISLKKANFKNYIFAKSFDDAFLLAKQNAQSGDVVLLSPACASFDFFKNYQQRGEQFEKLVQSIKTKKN